MRRLGRPEQWLLGGALVGLAAGALAKVVGAEASGQAIWAATTVFGIGPTSWFVIVGIRQRRLGADVVAVLALIGALVVDEMFAGAVITVMMATGRALEAAAAARATRDLTALVSRSPRQAHRVTDDTITDVDIGDVVVGDRILVKPGEVVPVDARIVDQAGVLDESSLTGESLLVERDVGDVVRSGVVNAGGALMIRCTARAEDSTYAQIIRLVEQSEASSSPMLRLADRYAGMFLASSVVLGGTAWLISGDLVRAVAVMVVATPCPLVLAAPVAIVAGLSRTARLGIVVKGGAALEQLAAGRVLLFDKTGTITAGQPVVVAIHARDGSTEADVARLAASLDQASPHVLASAVVRAARERAIDLTLPDDVREIPGNGVEGSVDGRAVAVGRLSWLIGASKDDWSNSIRRRADRDGRLLVFVRVDGVVIGALALEDPIRPDAARTVRRLRAAGLQRLVMVTGDRDDVARAVAAAVGVDEVLSERTPAEKVDAVRLERTYGPTIMVGDGINDAAALTTADVGVALGARGATAASEAADVVVMVDRIDRLGDAVDIARRSVTIARQSAVVGIGASLIAMVAAALGYLPPAAGAVLQEAIDVAVILNALRAMRPARGAGLEIDEAHTALSNQFQEVHDALRPKIDRLAMVADEIGVVAPDLALQHAREVQEFLTTELLPHEQSEDRTLYPSLARVLGGEDPTGVMSRGHAEIVHLIGRIGRILDDIDGTELMGQDAVEVRRLLYGLQAVLRLHFAQESEGFFSLVAANT